MFEGSGTFGTVYLIEMASIPSTSPDTIDVSLPTALVTNPLCSQRLFDHAGGPPGRTQFMRVANGHTGVTTCDLNSFPPSQRIGMGTPSVKNNLARTRACLVLAWFQKGCQTGM